MTAFAAALIALVGELHHQHLVAFGHSVVARSAPVVDLLAGNSRQFNAGLIDPLIAALRQQRHQIAASLVGTIVARLTPEFKRLTFVSRTDGLVGKRQV